MCHRNCDKTLVGVIIFSNCASDDRGMANVTVRFKLFDPNGNLKKETDEQEVWINRPAPKYRDLEMSVKIFEITMKKSGMYNVEALVKDKISGKQLDLTHQFKVF